MKDKSFWEKYTKLTPLINAIKQAGGIAYLVGGSVRDLVLGKKIKDIDIEVHKISLEKLEDTLKQFGPVKLVGKQFGVLRVHGFDVDWSLPRRDSSGRKPKVELDPNMTIEQAAKRRDLTMNAMAIDLTKLVELPGTKISLTDLIIDPYGGLDDIAKKTLRAVDDKLFLEDPLRFFRVMQFLGRFEMTPCPDLNKLCSNMKLEDPQTYTPLARERIYEEIRKLFLKSRKPSLGFRWLQDIKRLKEIFPELYALIGIKQRPDYHPEGDAFEHTMQVLDACAILDKYEASETCSLEDEKFTIMAAALCHDLGKALTTDEELHSKNHEKESVALAKKLLKRFTRDSSLIKAVCKLVRYHMMPHNLLRENASAKAYKRLAHKIAPEASMRQLALLALADTRGRNPNGPEPLTGYEDEFKSFLEKTDKINVLHRPEPPVLLGRHLLDIVKPGKEMGELLKQAYRIQIDENIKDLEELKRRVLELI